MRHQLLNTAKRLSGKQWSRRLMQSLSLVIILGVVGVAGHQVLLQPLAVQPTPTPLRSAPVKSGLEQLQHLQAITVKILATRQPIGSGVILSVQNGWYKVITNAHVLNFQKQPWQIETADGQIHPAQVITPQSWAKLDLALLQFPVGQAIYPIAIVNPQQQLQIGEPVIASGFPFQPTPELQPNSQGLVISWGQITHILTKPLLDGYQIGYNNQIYKGMSGGPLLNERNELVGINGLHDQPLWNAPEIFSDGTAVPEPLQSQIGQSSWAIPAPPATSQSNP